MRHDLRWRAVLRRAVRSDSEFSEWLWKYETKKSSISQRSNDWSLVNDATNSPSSTRSPKRLLQQNTSEAVQVLATGHLGSTQLSVSILTNITLSRPQNALYWRTYLNTDHATTHRRAVVTGIWDKSFSHCGSNYGYCPALSSRGPNFRHVDHPWTGARKLTLGKPRRHKLRNASNIPIIQVQKPSPAR